MQWTYEGKEIDIIPDEYEGFVYLITNTTTGQKYVGKKLAKFKTTKPPLKGKKNKRRGYKESDWRTYYGSSDRLNADVARFRNIPCYNFVCLPVLYFSRERLQ